MSGARRLVARAPWEIGDARAQDRARARSLSNLETIVAIAAMLRASAAPGSGASTVKGSIIAASSGLALENLGAAPRGGLARVVAAAEDRARRGVR